MSDRSSQYEHDAKTVHGEALPADSRSDEARRTEADPLERLVEVMAGKEESLEKLLNLLEALDKKGFLRTIGYFVNDFEDLVDEGIEKITTPQAFHLLSAGPAIKEAAEALDVTSLPQVAKSMSAFLKGMADNEGPIEINGMLDLLKVLKDPEIRLALSTLFNGLKSLGRSFNDAPGAGK